MVNMLRLLLCLLLATSGRTDENDDSTSHVTKIERRTKERASVVDRNDLEANVVSVEDEDERRLMQLTDSYGISAAVSSDVLGLRTVMEDLEDSACKNQSLRVVNGLLLGEMWALQMYDASAKSAIGLLWGDRFQLGNFDECLNVENDHRILGKYCMADIKYKIEKKYDKGHDTRLGPGDTLRWTICVPSTCTPTQMQQFFSKLLLLYGNIADISIPEDNCHTKEKQQIDKEDIGFLAFLSTFSAFLICCTSYHLYSIKTKEKDSSESTIEKVVLSFSLIRNLKKIFSTKQQNNLGLDAIAGIRTLAMAFIITGHALLFTVGGPVSNSNFHDEMITRVENSIFLSNPLLVDTFLFISAFLLCRLLLSELDKRKGKVNVIPIYIFRYIRVTSSYIVVIALYATILNKINNGPLWDSRMTLERERCRESWWANILYINNYVNTDNLCMFQSWYLSVDTQLFFLAPLIIYPLWKWKRIGECILAISIIVSSIVPFIITYINGYDPTLMVFSKEVSDISANFYFKEVYMKTHMRASTYFFGLCFGYILYKLQTSSYKISRKVVIVGWTTCVLCLLSAACTVSIFYQKDYSYDALEAAIYNSVHRVLWAVGNGWFIIACATNNAGFIGRLFSWKIFIPLSRLTFCAYLINGAVELHALCTLRHSLHMSIFNLTILSVSHICQTFGAALVLCLMFESPIHGIEKILLNMIGKSKNNKECDDVK